MTGFQPVLRMLNRSKLVATRPLVRLQEFILKSPIARRDSTVELNKEHDKLMAERVRLTNRLGRRFE